MFQSHSYWEWEFVTHQLNMPDSSASLRGDRCREKGWTIDQKTSTSEGRNWTSWGQLGGMEGGVYIVGKTCPQIWDRPIPQTVMSPWKVIGLACVSVRGDCFSNWLLTPLTRSPRTLERTVGLSNCLSPNDQDVFWRRWEQKKWLHRFRLNFSSCKTVKIIVTLGKVSTFISRWMEFLTATFSFPRPN